MSASNLKKIKVSQNRTKFQQKKSLEGVKLYFVTYSPPVRKVNADSEMAKSNKLKVTIIPLSGAKCQ